MRSLTLQAYLTILTVLPIAGKRLHQRQRFEIGYFALQTGKGQLSAGMEQNVTLLFFTSLFIKLSFFISKIAIIFLVECWEYVFPREFLFLSDLYLSSLRIEAGRIYIQVSYTILRNFINPQALDINGSSRIGFTHACTVASLHGYDGIEHGVRLENDFICPW